LSVKIYIAGIVILNKGLETKMLRN